MAFVVEPLTVVGVDNLALSAVHGQRPAPRATVLAPLAIEVELPFGADIHTLAMPRASTELTVIFISVRETVDACAIAGRWRPPLGHGQSVCLQPCLAARAVQNPMCHEVHPETAQVVAGLPSRKLHAFGEVPLWTCSNCCMRQKTVPIRSKGSATGIKDREPRNLMKQLHGSLGGDAAALRVSLRLCSGPSAEEEGIRTRSNAWLGRWCAPSRAWR
mmetsp:Transcript_59077/g.153587  ORF Transcript_59077/g.153587 Transcript_59077/m.153587 type:complete len:217 (-) Transcript_59077:117-767(-)